MAAIEPSLSALAARLDALESQALIRALKAAYMEGCDFRIGTRMGELFSLDGIWESVGRFATPEGTIIGRDAVAKAFASDDWGHSFCAHYLTNEAITVSGDTAVGTWMFFEPATNETQGQVWMAGRYRDDFVRLEGRWFIQHLRCDLIFVAPYATGWEDQTSRHFGRGRKPEVSED